MATGNEPFFQELSQQRSGDARKLATKRQGYKSELYQLAEIRATRSAKWGLMLADRDYMKQLNRDRMQQDFALQRGAQEIGARREAATTERGFRREEAGTEREFREGLAGQELRFRREEGERARALPREQFEAQEKRVAADRTAWQEIAPTVADITGMKLPDDWIPPSGFLPAFTALRTFQNTQLDREARDTALGQIATALDDVDPKIANLVRAKGMDPAMGVTIGAALLQQQQLQKTRAEDQAIRAGELELTRDSARRQVATKWAYDAYADNDKLQKKQTFSEYVADVVPVLMDQMSNPIRVREKASGEPGTIPESEFLRNPELYERL